MNASNIPENLTAEVRRQVRDLLEKSPAYHQLNAGKQRQIAQDTVHVASYLANPDGVLSADFASGRRARVSLPKEIETTGEQAGALIGEVDFPEFVAALIKGVFQAIVDSSVHQMEAYARLVEEAARSIDEFLHDQISDDDARDWLARRYPDQITLEPPHRRLDFATGAPAKFTIAAASADDFRRRVSADLNLAQPLGDLNDTGQQGLLIEAARRKIATNRQQQLATMVLMGINRIVVTDGK